jgi:hypothetical protein
VCKRERAILHSSLALIIRQLTHGGYSRDTKLPVAIEMPHGDFFHWMVGEKLELSLEEVYERKWEFSCPAHGPQRERPFQAELRRDLAKARPTRDGSHGTAIPDSEEQTA